jgi:hypothetical protein
MLRHNFVTKILSSILLSDYVGEGQNSYRDENIRIMLSTAVRVGWIEKNWTGHFEKILWQDAKLIKGEGEWSGTLKDLMRFRFWHFIERQAIDEKQKLSLKYRENPPEEYKHDNIIWSPSDKIVEVSASRKRRRVA